MIMKDKYIYLTFLFFLIYSASVYPTLPWDMQKGELGFTPEWVERTIYPNKSQHRLLPAPSVWAVWPRSSDRAQAQGAGPAEEAARAGPDARINAGALTMGRQV